MSWAPIKLRHFAVASRLTASSSTSRVGSQQQWRVPQQVRRFGAANHAARKPQVFLTHATAGNYDLEPRITREQLEDPAHIGASTTVERPIRDRGGDLSLDAYLDLPVEQYNRLDPDMIRPLGGGTYALQVPRVQIFSVWVEPLVHVTVAANKDGIGRSTVTIRAVNWGLTGSPLIESFGLARRFSLEFCTSLSWAPANNDANGNNSNTHNGILRGTTSLDVYTEVIGPFRFMPRQLLETGGNAVMNTLNNALLPLFMQRLCDDYKRWASDPAYRQERQQTTAQLL